MIKARTISVCALVLGALILSGLPAAAQDAVNHATAFGVSAPLGELAKMPQTPSWGFHLANPVRRISKRPTGMAIDPVEQSSVRHHLVVRSLQRRHNLAVLALIVP